jgi:signal transduction histidine kinase
MPSGRLGSVFLRALAMDSMSETIAQKDAVKWADFAPAALNTANIKILAVDDNEALRYCLVRTLRDAGYQVVEARTGGEALALAAENPDLITLDVHLPDMMGFDVCKQLKSNPLTSRIPILHLSSTYIDPEARVQGLASGADAYLAEPIDREELVATVGALLRLKNAENLAFQQAAIAESARRELAHLNETLEKKVGDRTAELRTANASLRDLSGRLLRAQDDERRRISRELHDSVGQMLAAIKMTNATIAIHVGDNSPQASEGLRSNDKLIDDILRSIRTISHLLHPPLLDESGLCSALRWYVEEFSSRSGIKVKCDCEAATRISKEVETALFRVVQECLGNVHRHSSSPTASVRFFVEGDKAHLEVKDEGTGISIERQQDIAIGGGGVGLRGMRERIAQAGGELQIISNSKGTTIRVVVLIDEAAAA